MKGIGTLYVPQWYRTIMTAIWCEIYVVRVGYIPYLKKFAKQLDFEEGRNGRRSKGGPEVKSTAKKAEKKRRRQLQLTISSETNGPEDRSQLLLAKDLQEGGPVSEEEVRLVDYKLN